MRRWFVVAGCVLAAGWCHSAEGPTPAERDWQRIMELAVGPGTKFTSRDEALGASRKHLDQQEATLRAFVAQHPEDAHRFSARIRLAAVLTAKGKLAALPALRAEGEKILADLRADPAVPGSAKADAGFLSLSQTMQDFTGRSDEEARKALLAAVRQFDADFPEDRRVPAALVEVATVYDDAPAEKRTLLREAQGRTTDTSLRQRIDDDFRRLAQLGKPVTARLRPWKSGAVIDLADRKDRAAVVLFWASWSAPSLRELARLEQVSLDLKGKPVDFYTVSLDDDLSALSAAVAASGLTWPVHCDGKAWQGELVRSLGINALPTVWVLDRNGALLTLNARDREAEWIAHALE